MDADDGGLFYFKKRPSDIKWDEKMEKNDIVGHPPYCDWFCEKHDKMAKELSGLTIDKAMKSLRSKL